MTPYDLAIFAGVLLSGYALGALTVFTRMQKKGYCETGLMRVGWCVMDDDDAILGYAEAPEDYAAIMGSKQYATAHPMFIKIDDLDNANADAE